MTRLLSGRLDPRKGAAQRREAVWALAIPVNPSHLQSLSFPFSPTPVPLRSNIRCELYFGGAEGKGCTKIPQPSVILEADAFEQPHNHNLVAGLPHVENKKKVTAYDTEMC